MEADRIRADDICHRSLGRAQFTNFRFAAAALASELAAASASGFALSTQLRPPSLPCQLWLSFASCKPEDFPLVIALALISGKK